MVSAAVLGYKTCEKPIQWLLRISSLFSLRTSAYTASTLHCLGVLTFSVSKNESFLWEETYCVVLLQRS